MKKSDRVKKAITIKDGVTLSKSGKKWGRKALYSKQPIIDKVLQLRAEGLTLRQIAERVKTYDKNNNEINISHCLVYKILQENNKVKV